MKNKELKRLANQFIALERIIEANEDKQAVYQAKNQIIELTNKLDPEDMFLIDEIIQEKIEKNS